MSNKKNTTKKALSLLKRKDVKALLIVRNLLQRQAVNREIERRATTIVKTDSNKHALHDDSTAKYIYAILATATNPMHINSIIEHIESIGWISGSKYHKYNSVYKALANNSYMFHRVGRGTFKLREAFNPNRLTDQKPITSIKPEPLPIDKITSLKDIVVEIVKENQEEHGISPSRVHHIMTCMGYDCTYSGVRLAMQYAPIVRDGFSYSVKT